MLRIALPDGRIATFPDDVPAAEIEQAIREHLDAAAPIPEAPPPPARAPASLHATPVEVAPLRARFRVAPYQEDAPGGRAATVDLANQLAAAGFWR